MQWSRIRWRLRGALTWPAFALCTPIDAVLLSALPFTGDGAPFVASFLLAGFLNLVMVGVVGPLAGRFFVRRRRPQLPREVASDTGSTAALLALTTALLAGGLAHRPQVQAADEAFAAQGAAVAQYVRRQAPADVRAHLSAADTDQLSETLFRTCVPTAEPGKHFCVFVNTDQSPPGVRPDPDQRPNSVVSGPDNPGRQGG